MQRLMLTAALVAAGGLTLPEISRGHGGTYRGPGDTVPPGGGGGGSGGSPTSPGPGGPRGGSPGNPSTPQPGGATTPGGAPGGGGGGPRRSGGSGDMGPDLSVWDFWWGFNKEPYLNLKSRIRAGAAATGSDDFFLGANQQQQARDTQRPSEELIRGTVVPALLEALANERGNDITTGALIALAKIGDVATEDGHSAFVDVFSKFLASGSQEISETAAIALGILADERSLPILGALMKDEQMGRELVGGKEVPTRTRAFAAFGLGLIGHRTASNVVRQDILAELIDVLEMPQFSTRDLKVGAMSAIGLIPLAWTPCESDAATRVPHVASRAALIDYLTGYMDPKEERKHAKTRHWFVRAHASIAIGRLVGAAAVPADEAATDATLRAVETLLAMAGEHSMERKENRQSALIGLGLLANAGVSNDADDAIGAANGAVLARLHEVATNSSDNQSEYFALIALAQAGSRRVAGESGDAAAGRIQDQLLRLAGRSRGQKSPWASLALGVFGRQRLDDGVNVDLALRNALRDSFESDKTPQTAGARAIALGLIRDEESADLLLQRFEEYFIGSDETRGYIAVALGLMGARRAIEPIQAAVVASKYRPDLLKQAAIALGLLGDKSIVDSLIGMLATAKGLSSQAAIASALGVIGDARSVPALVELLSDEKFTATARGFAAVALGIVCDKEDLPWNAKLAVNVNYRANTVTLTGYGSTGILDIL